MPNTMASRIVTIPSKGPTDTETDTNTQEIITDSPSHSFLFQLHASAFLSLTCACTHRQTHK